MATSVVQICNMALSRVGVKSFITSLSDQRSEAQVCSLHYNDILDAVLEEVDWPFARRRFVLTPGTETRTNWEYTFTLPSDLISFRGVIINGNRVPLADDRFPGRIELNDAATGKLFLCDIAAPEIWYTARITNVGVYTPNFVMALAWKLAAELGVALRADPKLYDYADTKYKESVRDAAAMAWNGEQQDAEPDAATVQVRGGSSGVVF